MKKRLLNKIIDEIFHPLYYKTRDKKWILFDTICHFLVERNPRESIKKFVKYNLRYLLR